MSYPAWSTSRVARPASTAGGHRTTEGLSGTVVEIGFGSGLNLPHYPPEVDAVLAVEPAQVARQLARHRIEESAMRVEHVGLDGQRIPLEDASCDAALVHLHAVHGAGPGAGIGRGATSAAARRERSTSSSTGFRPTRAWRAGNTGSIRCSGGWLTGVTSPVTRPPWSSDAGFSSSSVSSSTSRDPSLGAGSPSGSRRRQGSDRGVRTSGRPIAPTRARRPASLPWMT